MAGLFFKRAVSSLKSVAGLRPALSIRARLVVIALLAAVPLMLDRVRLLESSRIERIEIAGAEALDLARRGTIGQREDV